MKSKRLRWIDDRDVLAIHDRLLALHGGAKGLRSQELLRSALARPRHHHAYASSPDIVEMAALYTTGIVQNHPFVDGNKRTGFLAGILFLELNGLAFKASEEDATQAVMDLAAGKFDAAAYAVFLRANVGASRRPKS